MIEPLIIAVVLRDLQIIASYNFKKRLELKMKAIVLEGPGDISHLKFKDIDIPEFGIGEVLINVKALSINPVDTQTRRGSGIYETLKNESPLIIGWDLAGVIVEIGKEVEDFKVGDEVFGMVNFPGHGAAYGEYVVAPASHLALKPMHISFVEAAATTLAALTAYQVIVKYADVKRDQKVLIHGASGGVGHFAVQIARSLGAYVTGTSSAKNRDFVLSLGAHEHVDYNGSELENKVHNVDFAFDCVGGNTVPRSIPLLKSGGVLIGITGISESEVIKAKQANVHAYFILVKSSGADMKEIAKMLDQGILKPNVSKVLPFEKLAEAHQLLETGRTLGKIVLTILD